MSKKFRIHIGSPNTTHTTDFEYRKIVISWANENFPNGYTITYSIGYFGDHEEETQVIEYIDINDTFQLPPCSIEDLKQRANQTSVLVTIDPISYAWLA